MKKGFAFLSGKIVTSGLIYFFIFRACPKELEMSFFRPLLAGNRQFSTVKVFFSLFLSFHDDKWLHFCADGGERKGKKRCVCH